jgi:hypothetical protein
VNKPGRFGGNACKPTLDFTLLFWRAFPSHGRGRRFNPCSAHQLSLLRSTAGKPAAALEAHLLALRKRQSPANLGGRNAAQWFHAVLNVPGFKLANLTRRTALEAARVPAFFGRGNPAACFLIATPGFARFRSSPAIVICNAWQTPLEAICKSPAVRVNSGLSC